MTKPTVSKHWRKPVGRQRSGLNPTRTTPPCYNNTTLGNHLYAQRKGTNVTNPICLTCKNCSYKCAADCEHCVTQSSRAVLIISPLNLQTVTITRMLSSGGEGRDSRGLCVVVWSVTVSIVNYLYFAVTAIGTWGYMPVRITDVLVLFFCCRGPWGYGPKVRKHVFGVHVFGVVDCTKLIARAVFICVCSVMS